MQLGDARKLSQDAQEALRKRAIRLVKTARKPVREVDDIIGVARWTVYKWLAAVRLHGDYELGCDKRSFLASVTAELFQCISVSDITWKYRTKRQAK